MSRATVETDHADLQCSVDGCRNRWTCEFGFGKLCSQHDTERREHRKLEQRQSTIPDLKRPASRPFNEPASDHDEDPLPF